MERGRERGGEGKGWQEKRRKEKVKTKAGAGNYLQRQRDNSRCGQRTYIPELDFALQRGRGRQR